mgnify:FL=1
MKQEYIGDYGELCAARYLRERGVRLIASKYRSRFGEIDLILEDGACLAFVEVKTRSVGMIAPPQEAVDAAKQRRLILTASAYLAEKRIDPPCRFDVIEVFLSRSDAVERIDWLKNAFDAAEIGNI